MKPAETLLTLGKDEINALSDGIVLLDAKGAITGINRLPPPWLKRVLENRSRIAGWVADAVKGTLSLPAPVALPEGGSLSAASGAAGENASLCLNGRRGYVLVIRLSAHSANPVVDADAVPLMGQEMQEQLRATAELLRCFEPTGEQASMLRQQATQLEVLLQEVSALAELRGRDKVFSEDRFQLAGMVRHLVPQLPRQSGGDAIRYVVDDSLGDHGNIYGSHQWLQQALHTLLLRLAAGCAPRGQVRIELRQLGDFLLMTGTASSHANTAPVFHQLAQSAPRSGLLKEGGLAMDICRRIVDLHGGQLKLNPVSADADQNAGAPTVIESFTLTLPTGLPVADRSRVSCAECRVTYQALQYARDLAEITAQEAGSNGAAQNLRKTA
jgi:hypothetical protein